VLGPRPPPWEFHKIYRFFTIFRDFGVFNRAGKTVTKIGIYSKPPQKVIFMPFLINSRPNFNPYTIYSSRVIGYSEFFGPWNCLLWGKTQQFFCYLGRLSSLVLWCSFYVICLTSDQEADTGGCPQKGAKQAENSRQ
jgi:hypothetical protein